MDKQIKYLALLTLHENNLRGLHWKLQGPSFATDHARFGGYYEQLGHYMDEAAEQMITLGIQPIGVLDLPGILESDDINTSRVNMDKDYNAYAANIAAMNIFDELYACAAELADDESLPVDVRDVYTEHAAYYRIEAKYKLARTTLGEDS